MFQGRFQKILITDSEYLVQVIRYIHLNPVKANLLKQPEEWEFSSYLEYAKLRSGTLPNLELIQQQFEGCDRQVFLEDGCLPNDLSFRRLRYIHGNPKAANMQQGFFYDFSNYGSYDRLTNDGITQWHPAFLALGTTLDLCAAAYPDILPTARSRGVLPSTSRLV